MREAGLLHRRRNGLALGGGEPNGYAGRKRLFFGDFRASKFVHKMLKNYLQKAYICITFIARKKINDMANNLKFDKKVAVVSMLCEDSSIRGIER